MRGILLAVAFVFAMAEGIGVSMAHGPAKPGHGGQLVETADGSRIEFALREGGIRVWVRDHDDKPIPVTKVSGKATLLVGSKKLDLPLKAEGDALLADGAVSPVDKVTAILSLTVDGKPVSARFTQN